MGGALLLSLSGCVTPFDPAAGGDGSYREYDLAADLYEVRCDSPTGRSRELPPTLGQLREVTLFRGAERAQARAQARGAPFFCIASVQQHHVQNGAIGRAYVSYTIQTFAEAPRDREAGPPYPYRPLVGFGVFDHPALHACYDSSATQQRLRAKYDITGSEIGSP